MGSIRETLSGCTRLLEPEHLIGRALSSSLHLEHRYVSSRHAVIRWNGHCWGLKDLGSRNGTFLDGSRLKPGDEYTLRRGSKLAFGKPLEESWVLVEDSPPRAMAVPLDGGEPVVLEQDLLALPSSDEPLVTIYRSSDGGWVLEHANEPVSSIVNLQTFEVGGRAWRFCFADSICTTSLAGPTSELQLGAIHLAFAVSRDEEHVQLQLRCGSISVDMGCRSHNYLLLTLARQRLEDAEQGLPDSSCGWVYQDELVRDPSIASPQVNIDVFRIRRQFAALGVVDAAHIIERRPRTRQLRIGTGRITITQI